MAGIKILKDTNNKIWTDNTGKILKNKLYTEQILPNGLISYYKAGDIIQSGFYCSQWNDSVGTNHLTQSNAALQLRVIPNYRLEYTGLIGRDLNNNLYKSYFTCANTITFKSIMCVVQTGPAQFFISDGGNCTQLGISYYSGSGAIWDYNNLIQKAVGNNNLLNLTTYFAYPLPLYPNYSVIYVEFSINRNTAGCSFFGFRPYSGDYCMYYPIMELAFFNRALNDTEIMYNTNALKEKFDITF